MNYYCWGLKSPSTQDSLLMIQTLHRWTISRTARLIEAGFALRASTSVVILCTNSLMLAGGVPYTFAFLSPNRFMNLFGKINYTIHFLKIIKTIAIKWKDIKFSTPQNLLLLMVSTRKSILVGLKGGCVFLIHPVAGCFWSISLWLFHIL